jgi:hypothetical protein
MRWWRVFVIRKFSNGRAVLSVRRFVGILLVIFLRAGMGARFGRLLWLRQV